MQETALRPPGKLCKLYKSRRRLQLARGSEEVAVGSGGPVGEALILLLFDCSSARSCVTTAMLLST